MMMTIMLLHVMEVEIDRSNSLMSIFSYQRIKFFLFSRQHRGYDKSDYRSGNHEQVINQLSFIIYMC